MFSQLNKKRFSIAPLSALGIGLLSILVNINPVNAAEKIRLVYGPFNCSLSVESLKTYAETGEITSEFKPYTRFLNEQSLSQLRHWLQKDFDRDVTGIHDYAHSPEGEELLQELGNVITTHSERNGHLAIRAAIIQAAAVSEEWTVIDVIQQFPTDNMQINTKQLFQLKKFWKESDISQQP